MSICTNLVEVLVIRKDTNITATHTYVDVYITIYNTTSTKIKISAKFTDED